MTEIEKLQQEHHNKLAAITADTITADEERLEELRTAEEQRAERADAALAAGEPFDELPIDPEARAAVALTSSPGLVRLPDEAVPEAEAQTQAQAPRPQQTRRATIE